MQSNRSITSEDLRLLNGQLRRAAGYNNNTNAAQAQIDAGADGVVAPDTQDETIFKLASDANQYEMMGHLAAKLPPEASFTQNPKTNAWLIDLILAGKTAFVLTYLAQAPWIRGKLIGHMTEENKRIQTYFIDAIHTAIKQQNLAVVKSLLELECLSKAEYQAEANTAVSLAMETNNAHCLALLAKHNVTIPSDFTEGDSTRDLPYTLRLALSLEDTQKTNPAFFIIENYLTAKEGEHHYKNDYRKKINTLATLLRITTTNEDAVIQHQKLGEYLKIAYPTSPTSEFRKTIEALAIYNPLELDCEKTAYLEARKPRDKRTALQHHIIHHIFYGENTLYQCYFYLYVDKYHKPLDTYREDVFTKNLNDFRAVLSIIRDSENDALEQQLTQTLDQFLTTPVTIFGVNVASRPRFSTFAYLLTELKNMHPDALKSELDTFKTFFATFDPADEISNKIKGIVSPPETIFASFTPTFEN